MFSEFLPSLNKALPAGGLLQWAMLLFVFSHSLRYLLLVVYAIVSLVWVIPKLVLRFYLFIEDVYDGLMIWWMKKQNNCTVLFTEYAERRLQRNEKINSWYFQWCAQQRKLRHFCEDCVDGCALAVKAIYTTVKPPFVIVSNFGSKCYRYVSPRLLGWLYQVWAMLICGLDRIGAMILPVVSVAAWVIKLAGTAVHVTGYFVGYAVVLIAAPFVYSAGRWIFGKADVAEPEEESERQRCRVVRYDISINLMQRVIERRAVQSDNALVIGDSQRVSVAWQCGRELWDLVRTSEIPIPGVDASMVYKVFESLFAKLADCGIFVETDDDNSAWFKTILYLAVVSQAKMMYLASIGVYFDDSFVPRAFHLQTNAGYIDCEFVPRPFRLSARNRTNYSFVPIRFRLQARPRADYSFVPIRFRLQARPRADYSFAPRPFRLQARPCADYSFVPIPFRLSARNRTNYSFVPIRFRLQARPRADYSFAPRPFRLQARPCADYSFVPIPFRLSARNRTNYSFEPRALQLGGATT
ncbi:hypothetical protein DIRU0_A02366 [Diutina rugosa]